MWTLPVRLLVALVERLDLDECEDLDVALARFRDPVTEWVDHDEVRRELDLD